MTGNINKVDFLINEIKHLDNGNIYDIEIKVQTDLGFIDNVKLTVQSRTSNQDIQ